jgi:hypothetical protein
VILLPSDANDIYGFDRSTGEIDFKALRTTEKDGSSKDGTARYCLGVLDNSLYVGGNDVIRSFSLPGGRMESERRIEGSLGRACLTDKAIYVPVQDRVLQLDPKTLQTVAESAVTSLADDPVGNLYTDGTQIYGIGMERIYALMDIRQLLAALAKKIEAGDVGALFDRMKVRGKLGELDAALEDLEAAYAQIDKTAPPVEVRRKLYDSIAYLNLPELEPLKSIEWLSRAGRDDQPAATAESADRASLETLLAQSLATLAAKKPSGAAASILSAGELLHEPALRAAARSALEAVAKPEDVELLRTTLKSNNEHTRAMAAQTLAVLLEKEAGVDLVPLLDDESEEVQAVAAHYLANIGDRRSLAALEKLLSSPNIEVRVRTAKTLRAFTGQNFGFVAYETPERRNESIKKWHDWIAANGANAELRFPLPLNASEVGRTLVCLYNTRRIVEIDSDGNVVWPKPGTVAQVDYPWDCQWLPNGNRLAVSVNSRQISEFDETGRRVWYKEGLPNSPRSIQRLENGNTLIACMGANKVIEIAGKSGRLDMEHDVKWELNSIDGRAIIGQPTSAQRLDNGNTLVALYRTGIVVEVDRDGKSVWEISGLLRPVVAQRLPNGHTLIAQEGRAELTEFNHAKHPVLQIRGLNGVRGVQRTARGTTIVSDGYGIREFDEQGKQLTRKSILAGQTAGIYHY